MKIIDTKNQDKRFFLQNRTGAPEIVLIFPVTRDDDYSITKWQSTIEFVMNSRIRSLIVIDKTAKGAASEYFLQNFKVKERELYILPRSIKESHYETLGEIEVDSNFWVMQLHDDDCWTGYVALPEITKPNAAYYSKFFMTNRLGGFNEHFDFITPGRINFTLVPSHIWNQFSLFIQNQNFHVAGSLDSTLNQMVRLSCELTPIANFSYYYNNHHWATRRSARRSLKKLAISDGWENWASIEIALFGRLMDNLSSLVYIQKFAKPIEFNSEFTKLMSDFQPTLRRKAIIKLKILGWQLASTITELPNCNSKLKLALFISRSSSVKKLNDVFQLIEELESTANFQALRTRFNFWKDSVSLLENLEGTN